MRLIRYGTNAWRAYLAALPRASSRRAGLEGSVARILRDVRRNGDRALVRLTQRFDGIRLSPGEIRVEAAEVRALARRAGPKLVAALASMARRVEAYHRRQVTRGFRVEVPHGVLEEVVSPLESVGLYVPGGAGAYPSSLLMNAIPARVAGVRRIVITTPPHALESNPAVAAALALLGLEAEVYRVGGAQAVAALAYGTRTLPAVAKIVGPGNAYVAAAKRQVRGKVETDSEAGPSEVVVLADDTADPEFVAADLLAQAEHGSGRETVVLVTPSRGLASEVMGRIREGAAFVANASSARRALKSTGAVVIVSDVDAGVDVVNTLAPEHVEVITRRAASLARRLIAGAVFVGPHSPVAAGDYGVGPNHVLPTGGAAAFSSALSVRDFQRHHSRVRLTARGIGRLAAEVATLARAEGFPGHARSVLLRVKTARETGGRLS